MVGVLEFPGERSPLHARSQGDGNRARLTFPKPLGWWHLFFSTQMETGSQGVTTLGRFTQNPTNSLGSSTEGGCWRLLEQEWLGAVTPCAATLFGGTHGGDRDGDGANPGAAQAPPPDIPMSHLLPSVSRVAGCAAPLAWQRQEGAWRG